MQKVLLLICLLSLWALSLGASRAHLRRLANPAATATNTASGGATFTATKTRYCDFTIKSVPVTIPNKNGKGSNTSVFGFLDSVSDANTSTQDGSLDDERMTGKVGSVDYDGSDCGVLIKFWDKPNFQGNYILYNLAGKTDGTLILSANWSKKASSYKFYYPPKK